MTVDDNFTVPDLERLTVSDMECCPYEVYEKLRELAPVYFVPDFLARPGMWLVTRWDDVRNAVNGRSFDNPTDETPLAQAFPESLSSATGEEYWRLKRVTRTAMQNQQLERQVTPLVQRTATELLDGIQRAGRAELVGTFTTPLAFAVTGKLIGFDAIPVSKRMRWHSALALGMDSFLDDLHPHVRDMLVSVNREIEDELPVYVSRLNPDQRPAVLPELLFSEAKGDSLTTEEVVSTARVLLSAQKAPGDLLAQTGWALLRHYPVEASEIATDPQRLRDAVEESLRWSAPSAMVMRRTTCAVTLGDVQLPKNAIVGAVLGSANHDETRWTSPRNFQLGRREGVHVSFGGGRMICPGNRLARAIARVGLKELFARLTNLRMVEASSTPEMAGWPLPRLAQMWVEWDPA